MLQEKGTSCCVLFLICRGDAESFRPCHESCPLFAQELSKAHRAGVKVLAAQVKWDWNGNATYKRELPVTMPRSLSDGATRAFRSNAMSLQKRPAARVPVPKRAKGTGSSAVGKRKFSGVGRTTSTSKNK